jgi:hypothetical protein
MSAQGNPEVTGAIMKGAIIEVILLAIGGAIFFATDQIAWLIGAALVGTAVMLLLMLQAGAFKASYERH